VFIAQVLVRPSKQLKQIIQIEHNIVKNPTWPEANHLAIHKRGRGFELGATEKQTQVVVRAGLELGTAGLRVRRADHSATLPCLSLCLSACLSVSLSAYNIVIVKLLGILFATPFLTILLYYLNRIRASLYTQGVLRVRKRVTLMGVTVTAIFGICWAPDIIAHNLDSFTSLRISQHGYAVIHMLLLLSSVVNPFVYALVNKNFREKLQGIICCGCTSFVGSTRNRVGQKHVTSTSMITSL